MIRATQRAVSIGNVFSILMIMLGVLISARAETRWDGYWLMMIGFFLWAGAQLEERSAVFQSVLQSVRLEEIMLTDFATLSPADTLEDALEKAVHTLQDDFPVVRGSDMVGVVSRQKILEALRAEGNGYVQAVMNRIFEVAAKQESLASAFRKLSSRNLSIIPVVDEQHLVGIVTLQNLMHSMSLLAESRKLRREALDSLITSHEQIPVTFYLCPHLLTILRKLSGRRALQHPNSTGMPVVAAMTCSSAANTPIVSR